MDLPPLHNNTITQKTLKNDSNLKTDHDAVFMRMKRDYMAMISFCSYTAYRLARRTAPFDL